MKDTGPCDATVRQAHIFPYPTSHVMPDFLPSSAPAGLALRLPVLDPVVLKDCHPLVQLAAQRLRDEGMYAPGSLMQEMSLGQCLDLGTLCAKALLQKDTKALEPVLHFGFILAFAEGHFPEADSGMETLRGVMSLVCVRLQELQEDVEPAWTRQTMEHPVRWEQLMPLRRYLRAGSDPGKLAGPDIDHGDIGPH